MYTRFRPAGLACSQIRVAQKRCLVVVLSCINETVSHMLRVLSDIFRTDQVQGLNSILSWLGPCLTLPACTSPSCQHL